MIGTSAPGDDASSLAYDEGKGSGAGTHLIHTTSCTLFDPTRATLSIDKTCDYGDITSPKYKVTKLSDLCSFSGGKKTDPDSGIRLPRKLWDLKMKHLRGKLWRG